MGIYCWYGTRIFRLHLQVCFPGSMQLQLKVTFSTRIINGGISLFMLTFPVSLKFSKLKSWLSFLFNWFFTNWNTNWTTKWNLQLQKMLTSWHADSLLFPDLASPSSLDFLFFIFYSVVKFLIYLLQWPVNKDISGCSVWKLSLDYGRNHIQCDIVHYCYCYHNCFHHVCKKSFKWAAKGWHKWGTTICWWARQLWDGEASTWKT